MAKFKAKLTVTLFFDIEKEIILDRWDGWDPASLNDAEKESLLSEDEEKALFSKITQDEITEAGKGAKFNYEPGEIERL